MMNAVSARKTRSNGYKNVVIIQIYLKPFIGIILG